MSVGENGRSVLGKPKNHFEGFPGGSDGKASACNAGDSGSILGQEDPLEKEMAAHSSTPAWKSHGQRSMVGYSPWSHKRVRHHLVTKQQHGSHTCSWEMQEPPEVRQSSI